MWSFLRHGLPTAKDLAEEVRYCVTHYDKEGNVIRFQLRGPRPKRSESME